MSDNKKQISKCPPPITPIHGGGYTPKQSNSERLPRWSKWRLMPEVEQWEAVALSLNIEPGEVKTNSSSWMGAAHPFNEGDEFNDRLTILNKHSSNRTHFPTPCNLNMANWYKCEVRLDEFASWALSIAEWSIPDELKNIAASVASNLAEHESLAVYQHSEKLPLTIIVAEMKKDSSFVLKALQILSVEDVGSTHSPATAVSALINHWMVNCDLACYIQNERVDVAALTVLPVKGDYGKGIDALENWMTIDKEELAALLERRGLPPPAFLRQKLEAGVNATVAAAKVEAVERSITKQQVIDAFEGLHFDGSGWRNALSDVPQWIKPCRVTLGRKGDNSISATWNPVLIATALIDKGISVRQLDPVFLRSLQDWVGEWEEASDYYR